MRTPMVLAAAALAGGLLLVPAAMEKANAAHGFGGGGFGGGGHLGGGMGGHFSGGPHFAGGGGGRFGGPMGGPTLPPAVGMAVLAGMAGVLFGMAPIGAAITGMTMSTITSSTTTITSAIAS